MKKIFLSLMTLVLTLSVVSCDSSSTKNNREAQELAGAGATFPLPFYNVVFEEFAKVNGDELTIDRKNP